MDASNFVTLRPSISHHVLTIVLSIFLAISSITSAHTPSRSNTQTFTTYVKDACHSTVYPSECNQSLSPYASKIGADPVKLCNVSLSLALSEALSASSTISKLLTSNDKKLNQITQKILQSCSGNVKDSIGKLQDALEAMAHVFDEGSFDERDSQISNIKTWVDSATFGPNACYDLFSEDDVDGTVMLKVRKSVSNVAEKATIALNIIDNYILKVKAN